ncbi:hypothetical protein LEP1GSC186_3301 [Leptospira noguchii serovar Autumnalis str. ZUN142]|uniref:Uncharacterized protein n=1 Tax=Leptospira noguchii serovar Autumnalis str. ZUN142 TaxID=1085540 RepID=M6U6J1_9LEPT|nr:hypothetical protein LEP1GSC186_0903 [Leptospira noguchii serovar Autumnalis str. ZUN142]EMO41982.1 hypothetical protein LEP1GSC186_3301 [Leptospira noguchii serovar Autumnalis str. ZUN142]
MDLALLSTRSFSFFPPYAVLTLNNVKKMRKNFLNSMSSHILEFIRKVQIQLFSKK